MKNLCIDIGNTRVKWAVFEHVAAPSKQGVCKRLTVARLKKWTRKYGIQRIIVSSVRRKNKLWKRWLDRHFAGKSWVVDADTPLPIVNRYATPQTLGRDRLASSVGAQALFPNQNLLVIDTGTCLTCNFLDAQGNYWGGSIAPGLAMRFAALHLLTARLPQIALDTDWQAFMGSTTEESIRAGVQWGAVHELDGFIDQYRSKTGNLQVLLTGGSATYFESRLKNKIFVAPNLVLIGLNKILNYNVEKTNLLV